MPRLRFCASVSALVLAANLICALQAASADPASGQVVAKFDADNDKTLSLEEVRTAAGAHFDRLNKDGDSTLEANEVKGVLGPAAFKAADTDHDGTLSKPEYLALVEKLFNKADTNHDGTLTAAELRTKTGHALRRLID
jgi:Ca2+-binding EF-hand superfamily protein